MPRAARRSRRATPPRAARTGKRADAVLDWLVAYITGHGLVVGDPLPKEIEIARDSGASRSSVREALSALKVLGVVRSRRRGGLRLLRSPTILGLRAYLTEEFTDRRRFQEAMELRLILEEGLAPLIADRITPSAVAQVQAIIEEVADGRQRDLFEAERLLHAALSQASGNRLAFLLTDIYGPLFRAFDRTGTGEPPEPIEKWVSWHRRLLAPLQTGDRAGFVARMREHVASYHDWEKPGGGGPPLPA